MQRNRSYLPTKNVILKTVKSIKPPFVLYVIVNTKLYIKKGERRVLRYQRGNRDRYIEKEQTTQ